MAEETDVEAFKKGYFASSFRAFMDGYVEEVKEYAQRVDSDLRTVIMEIFDKIVTSKGFDENNAKYQEQLRKWDFLKSKGVEAFTLNLSWDWPSCEGNARRDGSDAYACELPPRETTTAADSSPTQTDTTAPPSTTVITLTSQPETPAPTAAPCGSENCSTMDCPDGQGGECRALPMGRGHACQCPPRTWTETYPTPATTTTPCGSQECSTMDCPDGEGGECRALPMGRGHACQCPPRTWTETYEATPEPSTTPACSRDDDCPDTCGEGEVKACMAFPFYGIPEMIRPEPSCVCLRKPDPATATPKATTPITSAPPAATPVRWTQDCIVSANRFEKSKALEWADELCEDADENEWSDEWFIHKKNRVAETKGIEVRTEGGEELEDYIVSVEVNRPGNDARYCDGDGGPADTASALEVLRKDPGICKKKFRELLDSCKLATEQHIRRTANSTEKARRLGRTVTRSLQAENAVDFAWNG